jgi:hypothetical protein
VIRAELLADDGVAAIAHWTDLRAAVPDVVVEVDLAARLASALGDAGLYAGGGPDLVRDAVARVDAATPATALVALVQARALPTRRSRPRSRKRARAHPGLPLAVRREPHGRRRWRARGAACAAFAGADSLAGSR